VKRRIVLLGPPASGKGTLADRLRSEYSLAIVSPGDLLRAEKVAGSELGTRAAELTSRGELVDDGTINELVGNWLSRQTGDGFVFDGYPRTLGQAEALESMLTRVEKPLQQALLLEADFAILLQRVNGRAICSKCGNIVQLGLHVSSLDDRCPRCGGELVRRADDNEQTLRHRLEEYQQKTAPLIAHYQHKGLLARVNTDARPDQVFQTVSQILS
jgi:adenylate kinase